MSSENKYINSEYQGFFENSLSKTDPDLFKTISDELTRQQNHIELIASENIVLLILDPKIMTELTIQIMLTLSQKK